jgi:hypothetical protein
MKPIQQLLSSRWMKLLAVLLLAVWCPDANAAYWNRNRSQTHSQARDLDGDGIPNLVDTDIDGDGIPNITDDNIDGGIAKSGPYADQYVGDHTNNDNPSEEDIDDDGLSDDSLGEKDIDGDGKLDDDSTENDIDGDGRHNDDPADMDIDGDGLKNDESSESDDDGDGMDDLDDDDDNNDGIKDIDDDHHHPESEEGEVQANLLGQPAAPNGSSAKVTLQHFGTGQIKFVIDAEDLTVGNYELLVAGVTRGTVSVVEDSSHTRGILVFKTGGSNGSLPLDFIVALQAIALRQGGTDFFTGTAPALPAASEGDDSINLFRGPGATGDAEAEVSMHFGATGPTSLEVSIENVPVGAYSVVIGDATRGTLNVTSSAGQTQGELHFAAGGNPALDFPSAGQSISITQGETTFFFGQLPSSAF